MRISPRTGAIVAIVVLGLGLWIALFPFSRPVPGGSVEALERTPEAQCGSPVADAFGDATATTSVFADPRSTDAADRIDVTVDCTGPARFRLATGIVAAGAGLAGLFLVRRSRLGRHEEIERVG